MESAVIINLISGLIPIVAQYGPEFVHSIVDLVHKNPGLTHEDYLKQIQANLDEAKSNDASVEAS